jgi:hypothetical protein
VPAFRHWPNERPPDPLDATHASHLFPCADPRQGAHTTRIFVFSVWSSATEAVGGRETACAEDVVAAPDGERQGGRGGQVCY